MTAQLSEKKKMSFHSRTTLFRARSGKSRLTCLAVSHMESHMLSHQLIKIDTKSEHIPFEGPPIREPVRESIPVSDTSAYCIFFI